MPIKLQHIIIKQYLPNNHPVPKELDIAPILHLVVLPALRVLPAPVKVQRPVRRRPRPLVQPQDALQRADLERAPQRVAVELEDDA
jgi:hypothetical protein